ncbi:MAG: fumarylacetoacetate hydrolase family protein [Odoribacteraceae bacterium]|nr:fumarylacetoacetate hydrolase family protein [Odoribacteraceae bacterium]
MKLLCVEHAPAGAWGFTVLGDNALLRDNDDFYVPPRVERLSCVPQLVFRIGKLGKAIAPRFAPRYLAGMGVGIRFYADDLLDASRAAGLPPDEATAFDHAAAISPARPLEGELPADALYAFEVNGREAFRGSLAALPVPLDRLVARLSASCLFKVGDLLYCGNTFRYPGLRPGDHLRLSLDGAPLLDFSVR